MRCEEVRDRLDDWVEGTLDERESEAVAAHVAGCEACRAEAGSLEALLAGAAALPREIRPPRDLWAGIDARLDEEPAGIDARLDDDSVIPITARRRTRVAGLPAWALAAAAIALVVVTAGVTSILVRNDEAMALKLRRGEETTPPAQTGLDDEARFLAASQELLTGLESQDLSPETMEIVRRNVEVIDAAIAELRAALERDPGNGELTRMLLATYQRKIELLEQASRSAEG